MMFLWFVIALPLTVAASVWFFVKDRMVGAPVSKPPVYPIRDPLKELYERIDKWEVWECEACQEPHVGIKGDCLKRGSL